MRQFGSILAQLRHDGGMNQRQLAAALNISQALLSHYENGTREPGLEFVRRVCDYFNVSADYMLGLRENDGAGESSPASGGFHHLLDSAPPKIRKSAQSYLDAAARRVGAHIHNRRSPLEAAQAALDMSDAELQLLQLLSEQDN